METRRFGPHDEKLPVLGLGCGRVGSLGNPTPLSEIRNTLARALELGVTLLDTADIYGQGDSEREIGRLLRGREEKAFLVTKVGYCFSKKMQLLRHIKPLLKPLIAFSPKARRQIVLQRRSADMASDFSPSYIVNAVDASLRRLETETVDGLLLHDPPAGILTTTSVIKVLANLRNTCKIRHYGVSCNDLETVRETLAMPEVTLLQLPLALIDAVVAAGLSEAIYRSRIAIMVRGVLLAQPNVRPATAVVRAIEHEMVTSAIVGISKREHLEELVTAVTKASPIAR
jgi:aryl-alcohol dehydrogenase-like predicted oxidoreductase